MINNIIATVLKFVEELHYSLFISPWPLSPLYPAVLILFLRDQLLFSENRSTAIFHTFAMLCYFFSFLGAIISDSCLGKYWYATAGECSHCHNKHHCDSIE